MYTNFTNIPFPLAVWLAANDSYDLKPHPLTISATSFLQSTKSLVLGQQLAAKGQSTTVDIADLIPAAVGSAVHSGAENSWINSRVKGMKSLGMVDHIIRRIKLNPAKPSVDPRLDVYIERRSNRKIGKWTVSGKFDFVHECRVKDIKTTKVYNWIKGSNDEKYRIQGSIYRWLNPTIITDDFIDIMMIFTDWSAYKIKEKGYPKSQIAVRTLELMSLAETERYLTNRLREIESALSQPQVDMPLCTPTELWMDAPKWAYYKTSTAKRATKLFDTPAEAHARKAKDGLSTSRVEHRQENPKFCHYCSGRMICLQADQYAAQGILK